MDRTSVGWGVGVLFHPAWWGLGAATSVITCRLIELVDLEDYQTTRSHRKHDVRRKLQEPQLYSLMAFHNGR